MKLYFIRHGETDWNKVKRLQGRSDIPLNAFGVHLAEETREGLKDVPFDIAYTSPLSRAKETAEIVLGDRKIPLIEDDRIEEMGFGSYEGLCCKADHMEIPDPDFMNFFQAPEKYHAPQDGETFVHLLERTKNFLSELKENAELQNKTVLISTHGAALCALLANIKKNPIEKFWGGGVQKNCAVTIVNEENGIFQIEAEGLTYYTEEVKPW